jgi:hypothetical protein
MYSDLTVERPDPESHSELVVRRAITDWFAKKAENARRFKEDPTTC